MKGPLPTAAKAGMETQKGAQAGAGGNGQKSVEEHKTQCSLCVVLWYNQLMSAVSLFL
jgi:hypothetical protein